MFDWFRNRQKPLTINLTSTGTVTVSLERLKDNFTLHIDGNGHDDAGHPARFRIKIDEPKSLKDLCQLVNHAMAREEDKATSEMEMDKSLLEGENPNIYEYINEILGIEYAKYWIQEPNFHLLGKTPHEAIRGGDEYLVRDILRQITCAGIS